MVTVKEVFDLAVEMDLYKLAHRVYWAITQAKVTLTDCSKKLEQIEYDESAIEKMVETNLLGIGKVKLFVIQTGNPKWYAFYLSESGLEANSMHIEKFREQPKNITRSDRLMVPLMSFVDKGTEMSIYEYRKKVVEFPAYVGHAESGEHVLHNLA